MNTCLWVFVWTCLQLFGVRTREHNCWIERVYLLLEETSQLPADEVTPALPAPAAAHLVVGALESGLPERRAAASLCCHLRLLATSGAEHHVRR